jgi:hypothetical protein
LSFSKISSYSGVPFAAETSSLLDLKKRRLSALAIVVSLWAIIIIVSFYPDLAI